MAQISPAGPQHKSFTTWAKNQGIVINGVGPAKISGSGLGIVAQRRIEAGETLVNVPASALLTVNSIPEKFRHLHKGITVHGLLASFLAFGGSGTSRYEPWKATWPSMQEFEESMPILWLCKLTQPLGHHGNPNNKIGYHDRPAFVLPPAIGGRWRHGSLLWKSRESIGLLPRQEKRLEADWNIVSRTFPDRAWEDYAYYWLAVNTRSFYFELPEATNTTYADRMVMCPFVDYFNHNDHGCGVNFDETGYTVISDRAYDVGEELQTSYGSHSNDFLLCEYGFMLENNKYDYLPLNDFFGENMMNGNSRKSLEAAGYLGNYTLNSEGVCFRTEVAIRRMTLNSYHWKKFMAGTFEETEVSKGEAAAVLHRRVLRFYEKEAEEAIRCIDKNKAHETLMLPDKGQELASGTPSHAKDTLLRRWKQILTMVHQTMEIHNTRHYHHQLPGGHM